MSLIVRTRLQRFRQHKLGWASFILFSLILILSLAAELIANDKPLLVKYEDSYYLPVLKLILKLSLVGCLKQKLTIKTRRTSAY